MKIARAIRSNVTFENYTVCIDHDLCILDYLSDTVCCMYGIPGVYGMTTLNKGVNDGINMQREYAVSKK